MKYSLAEMTARRNSCNFSHTPLLCHHLICSAIIFTWTWPYTNMYPTRSIFTLILCRFLAICPKFNIYFQFFHYLNSTAISPLLTNYPRLKLYFSTVVFNTTYFRYCFNFWYLLCVSINVLPIYWSCQLFVYTLIYVTIWKCVIEL